MPKPSSPGGSTLVRPPLMSRPRTARARGSLVPWLGAVVLGSAAAVLLGWIASAAVISVAWLTARSLAPAVMLDAMSQAWLGVHGVPFRLGGTVLDLTPLGAALLVVAAMSLVARFVLGLTDPTQGTALRRAATVALGSTITYALMTLLLGTLVGSSAQAMAASGGGFVLAGLGSVVGVLQGSRGVLADRTPAWLHRVPRAVAAGLAGLAAVGATALATAVVAHWRQIQAVQAALAPDTPGTVLLLLAYAAYLPNLLMWATAWASGAGFSVGTGTLLTPWSSVLGPLPDLPLAAALPAVPPRYGAFWLLGGVLAGALVALVYAGRPRRTVRPNWVEWGGASAAAAMIAGACWVIASWFSRGALGTGRLTGLGPRFPELIGLVILPLTLAAGLTGAGLAFAVVRWRERAERAELAAAAARATVVAEAEADAGSAEGEPAAGDVVPDDEPSGAPAGGAFAAPDAEKLPPVVPAPDPGTAPVVDAAPDPGTAPDSVARPVVDAAPAPERLTGGVRVGDAARTRADAPPEHRPFGLADLPEEGELEQDAGPAEPKQAEPEPVEPEPAEAKQDGPRQHMSEPAAPEPSEGERDEPEPDERRPFGLD